MVKKSSICEYKKKQALIVEGINRAFALIYVSPVIYFMNVKIEGGNG